MNKIVNALLIALFCMVFASSAYAWEFELQNVDGELVAGDYYTMDIYFDGEETDHLNSYFFSVNYNTDLLDFVTIQYPDYDDGGFPVPTTTWDGGLLPYDAETTDGLITSIMGTEPLGATIDFYPVAEGQTHMATLYFTATQSGTFEDLAAWENLPIYDSMVINDIEYTATNNDFIVTADGSSSVISVAAVPVPAAVWLLGSGLFTLLGIRRKIS